MLSLVLGAAAVSGDVVIELPSLLSSQSAPMSSMIASMQAQLNQVHALNQQLLSMQMPVMRRVVPRNPCAADMRRHPSCGTDSACLKRFAEDLAPECAAFLLGEPQPSPAPEAALRAASRYEAASSRPDDSAVRGFFSVTTNDNGQIRRVSGPLGAGGLGGSMTPMGAMGGAPMGAMDPMVRLLTQGFPPEIGSLLLGLNSPLDNAMSSAMSMSTEEDEEDEEPEPAHPCAREIAACAQEVGGPVTRATVMPCLGRHFAQLSHHCQCYVRQMSASRAEAVAAPSVDPPEVVTIERVPRATLVAMEYDEEGGRDPMHPLHRLSCVLFFTASLLMIALFTRALVGLCLRRRLSKTVVLVPPEQAVIRAVEANGAPAVLATRPRKPRPEVQVAEPLEKA